jgi:hypothetical protein
MYVGVTNVGKANTKQGALMTQPTSVDLDTQLASRLRDLLDRAEIATLVHRVGASLDDGRFDDFRQLFVEDASATTPGGTATGLGAMIAQAARNHTPDFRIQHRITDVVVELAGDTAAVRSNLVATFAPVAQLDVPTAPFRTGERYCFQARRTADGWRLTRVETVPVWTSGTRPVPTSATRT